MISFEEVPFGTPLYRQTLVFRENHLRRPLGLRQTASDVAGEDAQFHFAAVDDGLLQAVLCLKPVTADRIKLRQMCVDAAKRGSGVGSDLVRFAEDWARRRGFATVELHARYAVRRFYERLGYAPVGDLFEEIGLPHIAMEKALSAPAASASA